MLSTDVGIIFSAHNRANAGIASFNRSIGTATYRLRGLMTAALAAAGIGGLGYMLRQQMQVVDQMGKMSDELEIDTRALAAWDHAAQISGTDITTLHKGLEIFVRRLGEAKQGLGEGQRGLEMLGLSAQQVIDMGTEEAFLHIAEQIKNAGTAADRAGLAYQFFGRQGVQLINMFLSGREGIEKMRTEAEKLGLTFNRIDAAKVEAARDALTRTKAVLTGIFRTAAIELAPYIEAVADAFNDWAMAGEGVTGKTIGFFRAMTLGVVNFKGSIHESIASMYEMADAVTNLDEIVAWLGKHGGSGMTKTYKELAAEQRQLALQDAATVKQAFDDLENRVRNKFRISNPRPESPQLDKEQIAADKRMETLRRQVAEEIELTGRLNEPRQHAKMMIDFQAEAAARYGENTQQAIEATKQFEQQLRQLEKAQSLARIADDIGQAFSTAFEDAILNARNLQEVLRGLANSIQRAFFQEMVSKPMAQFFANFAGHLMGAGQAHSGGRVGSLAATRLVDSSVFDDAPKFHDLRPGEMAIIAQDDEVISRPGRRMTGGEKQTINNNFYMQMIDGNGARAFFDEYSAQVSYAQDKELRNNRGRRSRR